MSFKVHVDEMEKRAVHICLVAASGNITHAAEIYGCSTYVFDSMVKRFRLNVEKYRKIGDKQTYLGLKKVGKLRLALYEIIYTYLSKNNFNRSDTAVELGVSIRAMRNYVKELKEMGYHIPDNDRSKINIFKTCIKK